MIGGLASFQVKFHVALSFQGHVDSTNQVGDSPIEVEWIIAHAVPSYSIGSLQNENSYEEPSSTVNDTHLSSIRIWFRHQGVLK